MAVQLSAMHLASPVSVIVQQISGVLPMFPHITSSYLCTLTLRHHIVKHISKQCCLHILSMSNESKIRVKETHSKLLTVKNFKVAQQRIRPVLHGNNCI